MSAHDSLVRFLKMLFAALKKIFPSPIFCIFKCIAKAATTLSTKITHLNLQLEGSNDGINALHQQVR